VTFYLKSAAYKSTYLLTYLLILSASSLLYCFLVFNSDTRCTVSVSRRDVSVTEHDYVSLAEMIDVIKIIIIIIIHIALYGRNFRGANSKLTASELVSVQCSVKA